MKIHIKPRAGFVVPDPLRRDILPADGREVIKSTYWARRLKDGDVSLVQPTKSKAGEK